MKKLNKYFRASIISGIIGTVLSFLNLFFLFSIYGLVGKAGVDDKSAEMTLNRTSQGVNAIRVLIYAAIIATVIFVILGLLHDSKKQK